MEPSTILSILGVLIVPVIGYLLNKKDTAQEKEIEELKKTSSLLFKKHDDDVAALQALQIQIAKEHYLKHELDSRFQSLEMAFKEGMRDLGHKFDKLTDILVAHVTQEDNRR
jgi:hypothetical protein